MACRAPSGSELLRAGEHSLPCSHDRYFRKAQQQGSINISTKKNVLALNVHMDCIVPRAGSSTNLLTSMAAQDGCDEGGDPGSSRNALS